MPRHARRLACLCTALFLSGLPRPVLAQEVLDLVGGFQPDPVTLEYQATGRDAAGDRVLGCPGYTDSAPALVAGLSGARERLHLILVGEAAGFLAVGPDGIHRCEVPDVYGITHARIERVMSGDFAVWPLAAEPGAAVSGTLLVSEIDLGPRDVVSLTGLEVDPALLPPLLSEAPLDPLAEPAFGRLSMPDSGVAERTLTLAGGVPADEAGPGCAGEITQTRPDVTLSLPAPEPVLAIGAASDADTTLVVVTPGGDVLCNDDMVNYDPGVVIHDAAPGDYAIWVGAYSGGAGQEAVLSAGREAPEGAAPPPPAVELDSAAEPAFGRHELPAGGPLELDLSLAGGVSASEADPGCSGEIDPARPDATVTLADAEPTIWFHAAAEGTDTTLIVVGPDGSPLCNDDYDGYNPAVSISAAAPGDYAVWVGAWSGGAGAPATLTVTRDEPAGAAPGGEAQPNPFIGQPIETAAEALAILTAALDLDQVLTYDRLEETGPEGLILHGVVLTDPEGVDEPVRVGRIRVSELDLAGLSAYGAPERFALAFEDIAYDTLAADARSNAVPVPAFETAPPFSVSFSLLPPEGDASRRVLRFDLSLDGQIALALAAQMLWQEGSAAMGPAAAFMIESDALELELHDMGFVGALLREIAADSGESVDALVSESLEELSGILGERAPGSPRARLYEAVSAKLGDLDRGGVFRLRFTATAPTNPEVLLDALLAETWDDSRFSLDIDYLPDN